MALGKLAKIALVLAVIGMLDTAYLTYDHYTNTAVACPTHGVINCGNVLNSQYSVLLGVPFAVWGLLFFIIEMAIILLVRNKDLFVIYNGIGIAFVAYLLYAEYMIGNICLYCTLVHIIVVTTFIISILDTNAKSTA
jgi:uncharacterized membrane protein